MCFSAGASFAGAAVITTIGIAAITKVEKPSQILFASIPFLFGIQQAAEGIVWLTLANPEYSALLNICIYIFLVIALLIWPIFLPLSVFLMEENKKRKKLLKIFIALGLLLALSYTIGLIVYGVKAEIIELHIKYTLFIPDSLRVISKIPYLIVVIVPLFISSIKRTKVLGVLISISVLFTYIFYNYYIISVWCFFAAIISVVIYWILRDSKLRGR